jgi:hypothetical protein
MSLSGIETTRRAQIIKVLTQKNGVYTQNIERPVKVTHLLCSGDEETDKIRYANKFNARGEARIQIVWEEWFWDSLEFGGGFDRENHRQWYLDSCTTQGDSTRKDIKYSTLDPNGKLYLKVTQYVNLSYRY